MNIVNYTIQAKIHKQTDRQTIFSYCLRVPSVTLRITRSYVLDPEHEEEYASCHQLLAEAVW